MNFLILQINVAMTMALIGLALLSVLMFGAGGRKQKVIVNV